jgi:hypothetical protein
MRGSVSRQTVVGLVAGATAIAVVSAGIAALKPYAEPVALTGLYLFAILPVAILSGFWLAGIVAVASYLTSPSSSPLPCTTSRSGRATRRPGC